MSYHLEIYGYAWSGARCVYQYTITREQADSLLSLKAEPRQFAGDFQDVLDWRLISESNSYESVGRIARRIDTFKTLRGFRAGMTPRRFYRLANA